jgi:hypothetical protein
MPLANSPTIDLNATQKRKKMPQIKVKNLQHKLITVIPLLLVNIVAISGQYGWSKDHLQSWGLIGQITFALALESVAICIAFHAYLAEIANDSALKLKLASYGFGLGIGLLNYSHWAGPNGKPTATAIVVGVFSSVSPWLWGMYSRNVSRRVLKSNGLIEDHSVRLGSARWLYHPIKCMTVMSRSTWNGEKIPARAIAAYNDQMEQKRLQKELTKAAENVSVNGTKERIES